jgi:hypothetical protein
VDVGGDLDLAVEVAAVDLRGAHIGHDVGDLGDMDHARQAVGLGAGGEPDAVQVGDAGAVVGGQADHDHVVLAVGRPPQAGLVAREQGPQRLGDRGGPEAEIGSRVAAQADRQDGLGGLEVSVEIDQAADAGRALHHVLRDRVEHVGVGSLQRELELLLDAAARSTRNVDRDQDARDAGQSLPDRLGELLGRALAILQRCGSCHTDDSMGSSVKLTNRLTSTATTTVMPKG